MLPQLILMVTVPAIGPEAKLHQFITVMMAITPSYALQICWFWVNLLFDLLICYFDGWLPLCDTLWPWMTESRIESSGLRSGHTICFRGMAISIRCSAKRLLSWGRWSLDCLNICFCIFCCVAAQTYHHAYVIDKFLAQLHQCTSHLWHRDPNQRGLEQLGRQGCSKMLSALGLVRALGLCKSLI